MDTTDIPAAAPLDTSTLKPFEDSTELLSKPEQLRARGRRDGYLFFKGLLASGPILELRRDVLDILDRHGLRVAGADPLSGKLDIDQVARVPADDLRIDTGVNHQIYYEIQRLPRLHRLSFDPGLMRLYRTLLGADVFVHPRRVMRAFMPHPALAATPPHQDFPLFQGSADTWTCWFPVGDCPLDQGPLVLLRGSHRNGYLPMRFGEAHGTDWSDWGSQLCDYENDWVGGDFDVGDVLTFTSFTVHRASPMRARESLRLSLDVRYQRAGGDIEQQSLLSHALNPVTKEIATWDEIYEGWTDDDADLMYYWDPDRLSLTPRDDSLMQPGLRRAC